MTDEIVNELFANLDTMRVQMEQVRNENQKLINENSLLKNKVQDLV